jgi:hypothetical protein
MSDIPLKQIVDGFSWNSNLLYTQPRFWPNALAQLDVLRRAANYRARWFVFPQDIDQPIQPYDTYYDQLEVNGGSYLFGYNFACISATDPNGDPVDTTPSDLLIQAEDSCTGIPLFLDYANANGNAANFQSRCLPILLSQPRLILDPGLVTASISNRTKNTITCQLLLHFAEPCKIIDESTRARDVRFLTGGTR